MINEYALAQDFNRALSLSYKTIKTFCRKSFKEKQDIFKKGIQFSVVENNTRAIRKLNILANKCKLKVSLAKDIIKKHSTLLALEGNLEQLKKYREI